MRFMNAKKWVVAVMVASCGAVLLAGQAAAQTDPFDPNNGSNDGNGATQGAADEPPGAPAETDPAPDTDDTATGQTTESLPNTGADPAPWVVLAYALIAAGAGVLLVAYVRRPLVPNGSASAVPPPGVTRSSGSSR